VTQLARSAAFASFAFDAATATMEAVRGPAGCEHAWLRALAHGSEADCAAADALASSATGDWRLLGAPLLKVTMALLGAAAQSGGGRAPGQPKKRAKPGVAGGASAAAAAAQAAAAAEAASEARLPLVALKACLGLLQHCATPGSCNGGAAAVAMLRDAFCSTAAAPPATGGGASESDDDDIGGSTLPVAQPPPDAEAAASIITAAAAKLQAKADSLLAVGAGMRLECEALLRLLRIVLSLPGCPATAADACCAWAMRSLRAHTLANSAAVRLLVIMLVTLRPPADDVRAAEAVTKELARLLGTTEVEAMDASPVTYKAFRASTAGGAVLVRLRKCGPDSPKVALTPCSQAVIAFVEAELEAVEWAVGSLRALDEAVLAREDACVDLDDVSDEEQDEDDEQSCNGNARREQLRRRASLLAAALTRLSALAALVGSLLECLHLFDVSDDLVKCTARVMRCAAVAVASATVPPRHKQLPPSTQLRMLVWMLHSDVVPRAQTFMQRLEETTGSKKGASKRKQAAADEEQEEQEESDAPPAPTSAQLRKGSRHLPQLVKVLSEFEQRVLALETAAPGHALCKHMKRIAVRDFRLRAAKKTNHLQVGEKLN
jgi:hypothetical protein